MTNTKVNIVIQKQNFSINPGLVKGCQLHELAKLTPPNQLLLEVDSDIDIPVEINDYLILTGGEFFSIGDGRPPIIDNPCLRNPIRFVFNGNLVSESSALKHAKILGVELKALDLNGDPSDGLFADIDGFADEPIRDDQTIIIQPHHKFLTTPCGNVGYNSKPEGIVAKHFDTLQTEYQNCEWLPHPAGNALVIRNFRIPNHWSSTEIDLLIIVPNGYPGAALDMFYVSPILTLKDGRTPDRGDQIETHLDKSWQRFSWHYQSRRWNPSTDTFSSHIRFCNNRLQLNK